MVKPKTFYSSARLNKLTKPKLQHTFKKQKNPYLHYDFRGLLTTDYQDTVKQFLETTDRKDRIQDELSLRNGTSNANMQNSGTFNMRKSLSQQGGTRKQMNSNIQARQVSTANAGPRKAALKQTILDNRTYEPDDIVQTLDLTLGNDSRQDEENAPHEISQNPYRDEQTTFI